jgi:hypothetical protein
MKIFCCCKKKKVDKSEISKNTYESYNFFEKNFLQENSSNSEQTPFQSTRIIKGVDDKIIITGDQLRGQEEGYWYAPDSNEG